MATTSLSASRRMIRVWSTSATSTTSREFDRLEIQHFFEVYELEPGKSVEGATWANRVDAEAEVVDSYRRFKRSRRARGRGIIEALASE